MPQNGDFLPRIVKHPKVKGSEIERGIAVAFNLCKRNKFMDKCVGLGRDKKWECN